MIYSRLPEAYSLTAVLLHDDHSAVDDVDALAQLAVGELAALEVVDGLGHLGTGTLLDGIDGGEGGGADVGVGQFVGISGERTRQAVVIGRCRDADVDGACLHLPGVGVVIVVGQLTVVDGNGDRLALAGLQLDTVEADELAGGTVAASTAVVGTMVAVEP